MCFMRIFIQIAIFWYPRNPHQKCWLHMTSKARAAQLSAELEKVKDSVSGPKHPPKSWQSWDQKHPITMLMVVFKRSIKGVYRWTCVRVVFLLRTNRPKVVVLYGGVPFPARLKSHHWWVAFVLTTLVYAPQQIWSHLELNGIDMIEDHGAITL